MRPDYVHCIKDRSKSSSSYCGRAIKAEWSFQDVEHAFLTVKNGGRQMICGDCWRAIERSVQHSLWKIPPKVALIILAKLEESPKATVIIVKDSDGLVTKARIINPDRTKRERKTCSVVGVQYLINQKKLVETNIPGIYKLKQEEN